ncbi:MAG TPA: AlkA N-terminal domain-containing protein [Solirubrobacteraceae bacterium]
MEIDSELAATDTRRSEHGWVELLLNYTPPFDSKSLLSFLGARAIPGVEEYADGVYRRSLGLPGGPLVLELEPSRGCVRARYRLADPSDLAVAVAVQRSRALLDLDCDPQAVLDVLGRDPTIGSLACAAPGRRVAGHVDCHELAVRAVLGQQVSVAGAVTHAARLVSEYGETLEHPVGGVTHVFPTAAALAAADPEHLAMPRSRRRALLALASWCLTRRWITPGRAARCSRCRGSDRGRRSTSPCARFATPTRFLRPTSASSERSSGWASTRDRAR